MPLANSDAGLPHPAWKSQQVKYEFFGAGWLPAPFEYGKE